MSSTLVNIRLDGERRRKAKVLRTRGVTLSEVVREAIDERFATIDRSATKPDAATLIAQLFERHPDPEHLPPRGYDVHDRRAARKAIEGTISRARR